MCMRETSPVVMIDMVTVFMMGNGDGKCMMKKLYSCLVISFLIKNVGTITILGSIHVCNATIGQELRWQAQGATMDYLIVINPS